MKKFEIRYLAVVLMETRGFERFMLKILILVILAFPMTIKGIERRQSQYEYTPGYIALPAPYNYPGIGGGWMLLGYGGNMFNTPVDAYVIGLTGDVSGMIASVDEIFLYPKRFYLSYQEASIKKYGINMYSTRGMDSEKDDYNISVGDKYRFQNIAATFSFFERQLEMGGFQLTENGRMTESRDSDGEVIYEHEQTFEGKRWGYKFSIDWTDDLNDPREGLRFSGKQTFFESVGDDDPEYKRNTLGLTFYVPLLNASTWAFHVMKSDAQIIRKGTTDLEILKQNAGYYSCNSSDKPTECRKSALDEAESKLNANKYGTAESLGGPERLRSYPQGRYSGAHSMLYGTELRWNFNTDKDDIDLYFLNEIQEALQLCLFWEEGTTSEKVGELGDIKRHSYGMGVRLVAASGNVYRFEYSTGQEGAQVILMFNYPWGYDE